MNEWMPEQPVGATPPPPPSPRAIEPPRRMSLLKKIVIGGIGLGVLLVGLLAWWTLSGSGRSLAVNIVAPEQIQTGIPVSIDITMENSSGSALKDAQISVSLPNGFIFVGIPGKRSVENRRIGDLAANKISKETFLVMALGIEHTVATIQTNVSYVPGALSSRFEKVVSKDVVIGEAGITLNVAPPVKAFGGEEFITEVSYRNVSAAAFDSVQLKITYPPGFTFKSATVAAADSANSIWQLGSLAAGAEQKFSIKGFIVGQDNEQFEIKATMVATIGEGEYDIAEQSATVAMAPSPLSIRVDALPSSAATFSPGDSIHYRLSYANNTTDGLRDVIVRARLTGEMFDLKSLKTDGVLRSSDNTIIWNAARIPAFASLPPNASGNVEFTISTKGQYPITRLSSKNYTLTVHAEIESPTVPRNVAADKTLGVAELISKMRGALNFEALGYYRDTIGITNSGAYPPKVGQPTQFTIHWVLRNTSTDVEQIRAKAFLGPNVRYTGVSRLTAGASSTFNYNDRTQELTWDVPRMNATRGTLSDPVEAIFQVELTPAIDQVRTSPEIIQRSDLSYKDLFTGEQLSGTARAITIRLPDDPTVINAGHDVVQ